MKSIRRARYLARLVLVWFVLLVGVSVASTVIHPQAMSLVCTGVGEVQVWVDAGAVPDDQHDVGGLITQHHALDCPLCVLVSAPPADYHLNFESIAPVTAQPAFLFSTRVVALTAPPLPSRGPPADLI
jgi:hypothetical protein